MLADSRVLKYKVITSEQDSQPAYEQYITVSKSSAEMGCSQGCPAWAG